MDNYDLNLSSFILMKQNPKSILILLGHWKNLYNMFYYNNLYFRNFLIELFLKSSK